MSDNFPVNFPLYFSGKIRASELPSHKRGNWYQCSERHSFLYCVWPELPGSSGSACLWPEYHHYPCKQSATCYNCRKVRTCQIKKFVFLSHKAHKVRANLWFLWSLADRWYSPSPGQVVSLSLKTSPVKLVPIYTWVEWGNVIKACDLTYQL